MGIDLSTVTRIIAFTLVLVQILKPYLPEKLPAKGVAVAIGAALTAVAYFALHTITGAFPALMLQVILGVLGAPAVYEVLNGK